MTTESANRTKATWAVEKTRESIKHSAVGAQASAKWLNAVGLLLMLAYIAYALLFQLDRFPPPHFDEGAYLKVAKNYAQNGVYADFSLDQNMYLGPVVSTGPTVILPIAALFKVFGPGFVVARMVVIVFDVLLLVAVYVLMSGLFNKRAAVVAVMFAVWSPGVLNSYVSRSVMGEMPGLFFIVAGLAVWFGLFGSGRTGWRLVGAGVLFGLAGITKNQFALVALPALLGTLAVDALWYRRRKLPDLLYHVVPGLVAAALYAGWTYYSLFILGTPQRDFARDLALLGAQTHSFLFGFELPNNLNYLLITNPLYVPALGFGLILLLSRTEENRRWGLLFVFLAVASAVFLVSGHTDRYAVIIQLLSLIFAARLLYVLSDGFRLSRQDIRAVLRSDSLPTLLIGKLLTAGLLVTMFLRPIYLQIKQPFTESNDAIYHVADYLNANVSRDQVISTWDSEVAILTSHRFHFPNISVFYDPDRDGRLENEDWIDSPFLVIGKVSRNAMPYLARHLPEYEKVFSAGLYDIYRLKELKNGREK